jgi:hypothetical protein
MPRRDVQPFERIGKAQKHRHQVQRAEVDSPDVAEVMFEAALKG